MWDHARRWAAVGTPAGSGGGRLGVRFSRFGFLPILYLRPDFVYTHFSGGRALDLIYPDFSRGHAFGYIYTNCRGDRKIPFCRPHFLNFIFQTLEKSIFYARSFNEVDFSSLKVDFCSFKVLLFFFLDI